MIGQITNWIRILTNTPKTNSKAIHHRGTEAQSFTLLTAPQAQLTIRNAFLCDSVTLCLCGETFFGFCLSGYIEMNIKNRQIERIVQVRD